ncbi:gp6 protein [Mycobacteroides abscessus subsp. massiliense]|uniref:crossover junction endodeoxyribonuclease RuvC n=1 Tax=Mycobacteroides abscessus TaxID=36809 RepID=UPI0009CCD399|nr:crossover junction endodeoxyribonuclease RuvC [Mycobacteroides abscessus]SLH42309.1 gp6 protein [Mycobacteroides abscessus subsp. massiliense]
MTVPVTLLDPATPGRTVVGLDLSLTGAGVAAFDLVTGALSTAVHRSPAPKQDTLGAHVHRHRALVDGIVQQTLACDPALAVVEGLRFSVSAQDSSLSRRGFLWWAVVEGLVNAGAPVLEVTPSQIKMLATGNGGASKDMMVAEYALAWTDATRDKNVQDRADAAFAAALGAAYLRAPVLPFTVTGKRRKALAKLPAPSAPPRIAAAAVA